MTIELRDASLEARIQTQLQATGSSSVEEVLLRLLEAASLRPAASNLELLNVAWMHPSDPFVARKIPNIQRE